MSVAKSFQNLVKFETALSPVGDMQKKMAPPNVYKTKNKKWYTGSCTLYYFTCTWTKQG